MRITRYSSIRIIGLFRIYFICGLLGNFFALFGAGSTYYYSEDKNKVKWLGTITGFCCSFGLYTFANIWIQLFVVKNLMLALFFLIVSTVISIISIIYTVKVYKKEVKELIKKERMSDIIPLIISTEKCFIEGLISEEEYHSIKEGFENYIESGKDCLFPRIIGEYATNITPDKIESIDKND